MLVPMDENEDAQLGTAARLLLKRGHKEAAALLLEVKALYWNQENFWNDTRWFNIDMEVEFDLLDQGTDDVRKEIAEALTTVLTARQPSDGNENYSEAVSGVQLVPSLLRDSDWRAQVQSALTGRPANQATLMAVPDHFPSEDRMRFRTKGELCLYRSLKRAQDNLPAGETITISPGPSVRIPAHTWEPDFIVFYKGKAGIIEVDGSVHHKKWSSDRSRDRLFEDAGISYVDHIDTTDTEGPQVDQFVERFLRRLGSA